MAVRAIVGIVLGILFVPVIYALLTTIGSFTAFHDWLMYLVHGDFSTFFTLYIGAGNQSMQAPIITTPSFPYSMIWGFGSGSLLSYWLPVYLPALVTWTIIGAWAGAIERSVGRGIGVGAGIWLGWQIILMIWALAEGAFSFFAENLLAGLLTAIVVITVAAIFGAMTKSKEF